MSKRILYGFPVSSNTHRVRLALSIFGLDYEERTINLASGEQLGENFTAINPRQTVPVLDDGGEIIAESHAILLYLARAYGTQQDVIRRPDDAAGQARVAAWLFYSANELHNGIGLARNERCFGIPSGGEYAVRRAAKSLDYLDRHLAENDWLEPVGPTLADIAVYPFVAVATEAGQSLDGRAGIEAWLELVSALPGFVAMPRLADIRT